MTISSVNPRSIFESPEYFESTVRAVLKESLGSNLASANVNQSEEFLAQYPDLYIYEETSSTMDEAKQLRALNKSQARCAIFLARNQTAGRGRLSRRWTSEKDQGIYITLSFLVNSSLLNLSGCSLAVGIALVRTTEKYGVSSYLKWPNDVVCRKKLETHSEYEFSKLAGVLVEALPDKHIRDYQVGDRRDGNRLSDEQECNSVQRISVQRRHEKNYFLNVGIGLNLFKHDSLASVNGTCLEEQCFENTREPSWTYQSVLATLVREVCLMMDYFIKSGFSDLQGEWEKYSMMSGRRVRVGDEDKQYIVQGINNQGGLEICSLTGDIRTIYSGEVLLSDATLC